ncbi:unnamed protein product [Dibothriocephalus latus]|uniref:Uncharacterized protein n=1 Tax=Dibothriocephalus latus TaxID=60516 RepID=A0A3P7LPJ3_DIBLA|nr:unnamed protein product [Dibothriocephalus latus]
MSLTNPLEESRLGLPRSVSWHTLAGLSTEPIFRTADAAETKLSPSGDCSFLLSNHPHILVVLAGEGKVISRPSPLPDLVGFEASGGLESVHSNGNETAVHRSAERCL